MYYYRIYGLNVETDFCLDAAMAVAPFGRDERDVWMHEGGVSDALATETEAEVRKGRGYFYRYERNRGWVRVVGNGVFLMQNGNEVAYRLKPGYDPLRVAEVMLCLCLGHLLVQRERLVLHGSGIFWRGRALVISGRSGAGKSTLAAALLRDGGLFMADDAVAVSFEGDGKVYAHPTFPQLKLCEDRVRADGMDTEKLTRLPEDDEGAKYGLRFEDGAFMGEKKELHALIVMQVEDVAQGYIEAVTGSEKLKVMTENLYAQRSYALLGFTQKAFAESVQIANKLGIYRLVRPVSGMDVAEEVALVRGVLR